MSYSRWSNSSWYSFWNSSSDEEDIDGQILSLWLGGDQNLDFSYSELLDFTEDTMKFHYPGISDADIIEGLGLIRTFIEDVNEDFYRDKK
jgi:hypothetical protein